MVTLIRVILYGSILIAVITFFIISAMRFIKEGNKRTLKNKFCFTSAGTFIFFLLLLALLLAGLDRLVFAAFIIAFTAPVIFLIQDLIRNKKLSGLSKTLTAIPITLTASVLICLGLFGIEVMFLGSDFP